MRFYYQTKTKGRAGCSTIRWHITDEFATKAEVKRAKRDDRTLVKGVYTESELKDVWGEANAKRFMAEARPW